jgi:hypothetical protein
MVDWARFNTIERPDQCSIAGDDMDSKPFQPLESRRSVGRTDLPPDLARFYEENEGVGLESNPERMVRLCRLSEVKEYAWRDVPIFGVEAEPGWEDFRGVCIGVSAFLDRIYWVRRAPCCPTGSILTFGPDVAGPGGMGDHTLEPTLVLASSFNEWLDRLARYDWFEYGFGPGAIWDLPDAEQSELRAYYRSLNPGIEWVPF